MLLPYKTSAACCIPDLPHFLTDDPGQCRDYIWGHTGTHRFEMGRDSVLRHFLHQERRIGGVSVNVAFLQCTRGFKIAKSMSASRYAFQFILDGECELEGRFGRAIVGPGQVFVLDPEHCTREHWRSGCLQLIVHVERGLIERAFIDEVHRGLKRPLVFDPIGSDPGIADWLRHFLNASVRREPDGPSLLSNASVVKSSEHMLLTMLLAGLRHSESREFNSESFAAAPHYVRRAEEYMRVNVQENLSVTDIAAAVRVSPRSLFYGFRRWRGTTPMMHLRELRLQIARRELERARSAGGTVSQAALSAGFTNFSQFSKVYKARFGETPSVTLGKS